jgi:NAD-dependent SIR2 family protein deacetylase
MPPATKEQLDDAMEELFIRYPEVHVTIDILKKQEAHQALYTNNYDKLSDSVNYKMIYFKRNQRLRGEEPWFSYRVMSMSQNIFALRGANWGLYDDGRYIISIYGASLARDDYKSKAMWEFSTRERKELKREFKVDILPKIQECLEVVRKKTERKNGGELVP